MVSSNLWSIVLGVLGLSASIVTIVNPQLRIVAMLATITTIIFIVLAKNYLTTDSLIKMNTELRKEVNFHKDLINIKAELITMRKKRR